MVQDFETNKKRVERFRLTCSLIDEDGKIHHFQGGYEYVEIGGIKWTTCNVGANSITDRGLYFQWGDTQGYTSGQVGKGGGKKHFTWDDYKYCDNGMTKYNSTDGKTVLEPSDDAARFHMGGSWRMPTKEDFLILLTSTTNEWVTSYRGSGVSGRLFTSMRDSSKKLFFPACGYCANGSERCVGVIGFYWSSSRYSLNVLFGDRLLFGAGDCNVFHSYRDGGFPVRGVIG